MKRFNELINENVQQAKAYLKKNNIPETDEVYQHIRSITKGKDGYVGWLTKIAYGDIKRNDNELNSSIISELDDIMTMVKGEPNTINALEKPLIEYETVESFLDAFDVAKITLSAKKLYNRFPREQKKLINLTNKDVLNLLHQLNSKEHIEPFIKKISSYKSTKDLMGAIKRFLSGDSSVEFDQIIKSLEEIKSPIIHQDKVNDLIIAEMNYSQCSKIGAKTSWCIARNKHTFDNYVDKNLLAKQYAIYLTDKEITDNNRLIGLTINVKGYKTAHDVQDKYVSDKDIKKMLSERGFDFNKLFLPKDVILKKANDISVVDLRNNNISNDDILKYKRNIAQSELKYFTRDELDKYKKLENMKFDGKYLVGLKLTREEILERGLIPNVIKGTMNIFDMINIAGFKIDDFKYKIEFFKPFLDEESMKFYDTKLNKYRDEVTLKDVIYGTTGYKPDIEYSLTKSLFILKWYEIGPNDISLDKLMTKLGFSGYEVKGLCTTLSELGYFKNMSDDDVVELLKANVSKDSMTFSNLTFYEYMIESGIDARKQLINVYLKKNDDGTYSGSNNWLGDRSGNVLDSLYGYGYVAGEEPKRRNRKRLKKLLYKDYKYEYEKIIFHDNINEFIKYTLHAAGSKGDKMFKNQSPDKEAFLGTSDESWLELYGKPHIDLDWKEMGRYNVKLLMSYITLMSYHNRIDDLKKLKGIVWESDSQGRGWSDGTKLTNLSELIAGIYITNGDQTIELASELDEYKRYKLYEWVESDVEPNIKEENKQDLQLLYFLFDRNKLSDLFTKMKRKTPLKEAMDIFKPLFEYLIDSRYKDTIFHKSERFIRTMDLKVYVNMLLDGYKKITKKDVESLGYLLKRSSNYTSDVKYYEESNEVIVGILNGLSTNESKLIKFEDYVSEKVQDDFFEKNPNYYLSKHPEDRKKNKKSLEYSELNKILKKTNVSDIEFNQYKYECTVIKPESLKEFYFNPYGNNVWGLSTRNHKVDNHKLYLAHMNYVLGTGEDEITYMYFDRNSLSEIFKNTDKFYGVMYVDTNEELYLTTNINKFSNKLKELKKDKYATIKYVNNKVKGKDLVDYKELKKQKGLDIVKKKLKNISYDDIELYEEESRSEYVRKDYSVKMKDDELNNILSKNNISLKHIFTQPVENSKVYFGRLKNRFHVRGIPERLMGIGFGYKMYKALLKHVGYIVSDKQTSQNARKMYYNLLKDEDVYHIIDQDAPGNDMFDKDSDKVLLIWKDSPKLKQIVNIVRKHEIRNKRKYKYDKELLKYIKNIKE